MLTAGLSTWGVNQRQNRYNEVNRANSAFIDESRAFDSTIGAFVQAVINGKDTHGEVSQRIYSNLIKQAQFLQDAEKNLDPQDRHLVTEYNELLKSFQETVPQSDSVLKMQDFWNKTSQILVTRNTIIRKLQS